MVPARNDAANLPYILPRMPNWIDELILVDGNSSDDTVEVARRLWPGIKIVHQHGRCKGDALREGFAAATGDLVVAMDAAGSTDPAEIPLYVGGLLGGADFVKGSRYIQGGGSTDRSVLRSLGNLALTVVSRLLYRNSFSDLCYGYTAFWRRLLPVFEPDAPGIEIEAQMSVRALARGLTVYEVPSFERVRVSSRSSLRALPDGWRVLRTVVGERLHGRITRKVPPSVEASRWAHYVEAPPRCWGQRVAAMRVATSLLQPAALFLPTEHRSRFVEEEAGNLAFAESWGEWTLTLLCQLMDIWFTALIFWRERRG